MKHKYVVLALIAFMFAITSAVASFVAPERVYVKVKLTSSPSAPTICQDTGVECDHTGFSQCTVVMPVQTGANTASTLGIFATFRAGCVDVLWNTTSDVQTSEVPVYRLVSENEFRLNPFMIVP